MIIDWINNLINTNNQITAIVALIVFIWIISSIIRNITTILEGVEKGYLNLIKLVKFILSVFLLPFKLIIKFFKFIFGFKSRIEYKKYIKSSAYNVYPERFKINPIRYIFSLKIRREAKTRFKCIEHCFETQEFINNNMKFITMIETSVGGGKSSLMAGLTHYKTINFQEMISEKINNTQKILYLLDWNRINQLIQEYYQTDTKINNILDKILNDNELSKQFQGFYNNFRQDTPKVTLLKDYITAYCALLRNNYVLANYRLYNRLTDTFNIDLQPNFFDIKTFEGRQNYYIPAYSIIVEDELSLSSLKNTSSYHEIDKVGRDTTMRLFRQLKNETAFYIGSAQNISRNAKIFRELANSYFEILSMDLIGVQKTYSRIFQKKENRYINKLSKKRYQNKLPELKKKIFDCYQEQNKIFAAGFIRYTVRIAKNMKDLERFDKSDLKVQELYIPMTWSFGTYLKCQFEEFDKYLNDISKKSDSDLKVIDSFFENSDPKAFEFLIKNKDVDIDVKKENEKKKGE